MHCQLSVGSYSNLLDVSSSLQYLPFSSGFYFFLQVLIFLMHVALNAVFNLVSGSPV